jgi:hypothetical protein
LGSMKNGMRGRNRGEEGRGGERRGEERSWIKCSASCFCSVFFLSAYLSFQRTFIIWVR